MKFRSACWPALGLVALSVANVVRAEEPFVDVIPVEPLPTPVIQPKRTTPAAIDNIVVTATKREANIRDLPMSVSALGGDELEKLGAQGQEDFLKLIPGVSFSNDTVNANRITVRGIGADLNTSNTTGVFIGDVPFEDPTLPRVTLDPNPFDLARIEVLKGPQGTLFGGSALNGAVRYVPQDARLGAWESKVYAQLEDVAQGELGHGYGAALNVPVGDTLAVRLIGYHRRGAGWVDDRGRGIDDVNASRQTGGRIMARWEPAERWTVSAMAIMQDTKVDDLSITDNREGELSRSNTPQASPTHPRYDLQTIGIQYAFDQFDLLSQSSRTFKRFDGRIDASRIGTTIDNPPPSLTIVNKNQSQSFMQELRLTSNLGSESAWSWLGGAFYRRIQLDEVTDILASNLALPIPAPLLEGLGSLIPGFGGFITEDGRLNTVRGEADPIVVTETALFGEVTRRYWDRLDVTVGARLFRTESESRVIFSGVLAANQTLPTLSTASVNEGRLVEQGVNPKLALKLDVNDHVSLYAAAARGFRFGGAQVLVGTFTSQTPAFYQSDVLWSYEAGIRTQWLDETLIVDVTPFLIDWKDPQLQQSDATGLGAFFSNVGGARSRGIEASVTYLTPIEGLLFSVAGAYVDTVTTEPFTTSDGVDTEPGTRWPLAAKWQSVSSLRYQRPLVGAWDAAGVLTYATISSAPNTLSLLDTVFGYQTLDAGLSFTNSEQRGQPELSLTLSNATDERGALSGINNPQFTRDRNYIRPRTLIARLSLSFQ